MNAFEKVYKAVGKIPKGKVTTYGQIAKLHNLKSINIHKIQENQVKTINVMSK